MFKLNLEPTETDNWRHLINCNDDIIMEIANVSDCNCKIGKETEKNKNHFLNDYTTHIFQHQNNYEMIIKHLRFTWLCCWCWQRQYDGYNEKTIRWIHFPKIKKDYFYNAGSVSICRVWLRNTFNTYRCMYPSKSRQRRN